MALLENFRIEKDFPRAGWFRFTLSSTWLSFDVVTSSFEHWSLRGFSLENGGHVCLFKHVKIQKNPSFQLPFALITAMAVFLISYSIRAGNVVVAWNGSGQTNVAAEATNVMAIASGEARLALRSDGTAIAWGPAGTTNVPLDLTNVVAIASGYGQSLALKIDGSLAAWGKPVTLITTNIPPGLTNIVAVACGDNHNLVLRENGTIFAWGANYSGQTNIPADLNNVVAIVAGNSSNLAIKRDGTIWGSASFTNRINGISNIVAGALVANGSQGVVVSGNGSAFAWGYPTVLSNAVVSNVIAVAGFSPFNQAGSVWMVKRDGTVVGLGISVAESNFLATLTNVIAIAPGLAIVGDGLPVPMEPFSSWGFSSNHFSLIQPTSRGRFYRLEYSDSLENGGWQVLPPLPGDGGIHLLTDPNPPVQQRFYQVRVSQ